MAEHNIKPLERVSRDEVRLLAQAAANRGEPLAQANVFPDGTANHRHFAHDYRERARALGIGH